MFKRYIIFVLLISVSFLNSYAQISNYRSIPILCYHHISTDNKTKFSRSAYALTKVQFEAQMKYLNENGFKTISLENLYDFISGKNVELPEKPIVITFDDGLKSHLEIAIPTLNKYNYKGVFFIYPSVIISKSKNIRKWHLTIDELIKLHKFGGNIQSHSYYHPLMHRENEKVNKTQFFLSKKWLEKNIGKKIEYFAYPFGSYTKNIMELGYKAGYKGLFSINNGPVYNGQNPLSINRFMITKGHSLKTFSLHVNSTGLRIKEINSYDGAVRTKTGQIKVTLLDKPKSNEYRFSIQLNGGPVKNITYNEQTGELVFTPRRYLNGLNMAQIIFYPKKSGKKALIAGWTFVYTPIKQTLAGG